MNKIDIESFLWNKEIIENPISSESFSLKITELMDYK